MPEYKTWTDSVGFLSLLDLQMLCWVLEHLPAADRVCWDKLHKLIYILHLQEAQEKISDFQVSIKIMVAVGSVLRTNECLEGLDFVDCEQEKNYN